MEAAIRNLNEYTEIPGHHLAFEEAMAKCIESRIKNNTQDMTEYQKNQLGTMCKLMVKGMYTKKTFKFQINGVEKNAAVLLKIYPRMTKGLPHSTSKLR